MYHNLFNEETPSIHKGIFAFDIVFCRNVMIYFDDAVNRRVVNHLHGALVEGGWLFVGATDFNPHLDRTFAIERHRGTILYRKATAHGVASPAAAADSSAVSNAPAARVFRPAPPIRRRRTAKR